MAVAARDAAMLTGLVVGKFSPLHKGHEALIEFASARCGRLVILSYSKPEFPDCPAERRAAWLEALYPDAIRLVLDDGMLAEWAKKAGEPPRTLPDNDAPAAAHRRFVGWVCRAMLGLSVDRVFTSESYGAGFAAALGREQKRAVEHFAFDPMRSIVAISGTRLRDDPTSRRAYLSEPVRRSLVRRVAVIGGESTGKTTLAAALAAKLGTCWVPEYGRELWQRRDGKLCFDDMLAIGCEQVAREERSVSDADGWLICDTTPMVTAFYSDALFGRVDPELVELSKRRYDHVFLCAADFPFVQDGTRRDAAFRESQTAWYLQKVESEDVPHSILEGSVMVRADQALERLGRLEAGV
jgi:HTH-type transcriptional repressor of NAD biosynthesis genes